MNKKVDNMDAIRYSFTKQSETKKKRQSRSNIKNNFDDIFQKELNNRLDNRKGINYE